jgi:hypothetical protein
VDGEGIQVCRMDEQYCSAKLTEAQLGTSSSASRDVNTRSVGLLQKYWASRRRKVCLDELRRAGREFSCLQLLHESDAKSHKYGPEPPL